MWYGYFGKKILLQSLNGQWHPGDFVYQLDPRVVNFGLHFFGDSWWNQILIQQVRRAAHKMHCQRVHFLEFTPENTVEAFWSLLLLRTDTIRGPRRGQWQCSSPLSSTHPSFCLKYTFFFFLSFPLFGSSIGFLLLLGFLLQPLLDLSAVTSSPLSHAQVLHILCFHHALPHFRIFHVVLKGLPWSHVIVQDLGFVWKQVKNKQQKIPSQKDEEPGLFLISWSSNWLHHFQMSAWNNGRKSGQNFGSSSLFCSSFMSSFISSYSMSPHKDTSFGTIQLHGFMPCFVYSVLYYSCANLLWCRDLLDFGKALLLHMTSTTGKLCN